MELLRTSFSWVGSEETLLDSPAVTKAGCVTIGRYGGHTAAGAKKNEDGCLVWCNKEYEWEFTMILDAHNTAQSAEIVLDALEKERESLHVLLNQPAQSCLPMLEERIVSIFQSPAFKEKCSQIKGETACLIAVRKSNYLWWFSVGDNLIFLFADELKSLGQQQLNTRNFYEWIGQVNTFDQEVPCYSTGRRELRQGNNLILLTTDGLVECPNEPFTDHNIIYKRFQDRKNDEAVQSLLEDVQYNKGTDSVTMLAWNVNNTKKAAMPSNMPSL
ncbi:protein phosphatase 2C domain-containing protein [Fictibacillus iocasae]|uniref:Protein phosphatase 2C domain-containing protein n=1 Tax=Fictibacillus iocasae TaxID=2715437 RepID=A0ABW2NST9_9BACL